MTDITDVKVEKFEAEASRGVVVLPESEMRKVVIPSPPSVKMVPTNPRDCIIALGIAVTDELKAYAKENKLVFVCVEDGEAEDIETAYEYVKMSAFKLNIKKDSISVKATAEKMELAEKLVEAIMEENDDADIADAEVFSF